MKAVGYKKSLPIENADSLIDFETAKPEPRGRDIRVTVKAISANPVDYKVRKRAAPPEGETKILGYDAAGVVDAVGYGSFGAGEFFAGEGAPAPDAPAGSSLARRFADVDTDDNAADWLMLDVPTPGAAPLVGVPEPSTAVLFAGGLALLARLSRRRVGAR